MKKYISIIPALLSFALLSAQEVAQPVQSAVAPSEDNSMLYLLVTAMGLMLISIIVLSKVFLNLTELVIKKQKGVLTTLALLILLTFGATAQDTAGTVAPIADTGSGIMQLSSTIVTGTIVLCAEIATVLFLLFQINRLLNILSPKPSKQFTFHLPKALDNFNKSVAIESETDIMLDHDYDGIKELDNDLPPWWKYGFYLTIIWAIVYFGYFHLGGDGKLSKEEYTTEMETARAAKEEFMRHAKNNVDENTVVFDKEMIAEGSTIFTANCAACHGNAGEGNVGPNLTDEYWLHGGDIPAIFKTIKYGWPNKGMKAWESDFTPVQMQALTSYIHSIQGSNPANPKAPQGEKLTAGPAATTDSTAVKAPAADSVIVAVGK